MVFIENLVIAFESEEVDVYFVTLSLIILLTIVFLTVVLRKLIIWPVVI